MTTTEKEAPDWVPVSVSQDPKVRPQRRRIPQPQPPYHVILFDDDDHTYEYVIGMLRKLFGHPPEQALRLATEVDTTGRVIVETTTLERAELKRDQIHGFGRDWRIPHCQGSMRATIEPAA
jgi:ATP-dependent Clp protease adaptor protein ClpS